MAKVQSAVNFEGKKLEKCRSGALNLFPKIDPEFYSDTTPNFFWQKEMKRISSEKKFLERPQTERNRTTEGNDLNFYKSSVFDAKPKKKIEVKKVEHNHQKTKNVTIE